MDFINFWGLFLHPAFSRQTANGLHLGFTSFFLFSPPLIGFVEHPSRFHTLGTPLAGGSGTSASCSVLRYSSTAPCGLKYNRLKMSLAEGKPRCVCLNQPPAPALHIPAPARTHLARCGGQQDLTREAGRTVPRAPTACIH